ncbi:MAG: arginine--tRNA ligase, partial [Candidatus Omnitrophota bacterium]
SVTKEYYLNDEGNQINLLARSIQARYYELYEGDSVLPEGGYKGQYVYDIAKELSNKYGDSLVERTDAEEIFMSFGVKCIMEMIEKDLSDFGVNFDSFYSQAEMSKSGKVEKSLKKLKSKGLTYEKDGALWFESTKFGDDKDRVLRKSDGAYTYLTPDIAYHEEKYKRGYDWLIDMWGPDHHGYIPRIKAASLANGRDKDALTVLIIQLATISRGGKVLAMSTREGEFITLREVLDEVGKDVARFFFLTRRCDSHLDFDLELAKKQSNDNPVYYIQYAHARICGILNNIGDSAKKLKIDKSDICLLKSKEEIDILKVLREFPAIVEWAGKSLEPHRVILYLMELAAVFHVFYTKHRVISDNPQLMNARLLLLKALKSIFSRSLALLGVSYPEKM